MPYALLLEDPAYLVQGSGPDLTWLMSTSAVLIVVIGVLALLFRRVVVGSVRGRAAQRDLKILDVLPLGGKRQLAVVRLYDRTFALGLGEKSVDLVAELDSEVVDHDRARDRSRGGEQRSATSRSLSSFDTRLQAAKDRLLGVHEIVPQPQPQAQPQPRPQPSSAPKTASATVSAAPSVSSVTPRQVPPTSPTSTKEFLA
ncbi:MAG: flagellar biosynthetic protein FliO [Planctomycetota bacterium]